MRTLRQMLPGRLLVLLKDWRDGAAVRKRHVQAWRQLQACARALSEACLADIRSRREWEERRVELRRQLQWMLGLDPLPPRTALSVQVTGVLERPRYRVEKIVFQSQPGLYVTGNLYLPRAAAGPVPCVLYQCGHAAHPTGAKTRYQDRYVGYPCGGLACLALDPLGYGEVPGLHHGTHDLGRWEWFSAGYTPAGVEVWNAMRALDWLETRPEIDATRLGATGISGGGVMTLFLAALDERIQAAAPSCSTYTVGSQAARGLVVSQCDCTFYPNVFGLDYPVVAALVAPRPLLIMSGKRDHIFPPAGYRELFRRARRIYELHPGGAERIRLVESNQGHTDPPLFLSEAHGWMGRWLRGTVSSGTEETGSRPGPQGSAGAPPVATPVPAPAVEPPEALVCLETRPAGGRNAVIHEEFLPLAASRLPDSGAAWQHRRSELLRELRSYVFSWFPAQPAAPVARCVAVPRGGGAGFFRASEWEVETEPGVSVKANLLEPGPQRGGAGLLVVVQGRGDWVVVPGDEVLPLLGTHVVLRVQPRFSERALGGRDYTRLERTAALVGRTVAALQVWDVLRVLAWAVENPHIGGGPVAVHGQGNAGVVALYAALLDDRVGHVLMRDPPGSHRHGPALLTVLRFTDLPEVAAALAPRTLTVLGTEPASFELAAAVFQLEGAEAHYRRGESLADALLGTAGMAGEPGTAAGGREGRRQGHGGSTL